MTPTYTHVSVVHHGHHHGPPVTGKDIAALAILCTIVLAACVTWILLVRRRFVRRGERFDFHLDSPYGVLVFAGTAAATLCLMLAGVILSMIKSLL